MLPAHLSLVSPAVLDALLAHGVTDLQHENAALWKELSAHDAVARGRVAELEQELAYVRETCRLLYSRFLFNI